MDDFMDETSEKDERKRLQNEMNKRCRKNVKRSKRYIDDDSDSNSETISSSSAVHVPTKSLSVKGHKNKDKSLIQVLEEETKNPKYDRVREILPLDEDYKYIISDFEDLEDGKFHVKLRLNLDSKAHVLEWKKKFEESSDTNFCSRKTFPENSSKIVFKKLFRCHHNTMPHRPSRPIKKEPHAKHVECPSTVMFTVKNQNMKRSSDDLLKHYPCEISLHHIHNHPLHASDVLRHRRPKEDVVKKFELLLGKGHSPSSALETHQFDLQELHGDKYFEVAADGAECPSLKWCYYWFYKIFRKHYGAPDGEAMVSSLRDFVRKYNESCGSTCAEVSPSEESQLFLVLCSPMMKRVHENLKSCGEIMFMDSSGTMDRHNTRLFVLLAPSVAGALPVGLIMTFSESQEVLTRAIALWKSILPDGAFYGNGQAGPSIVMTDDSSSLRNSLHDCFPSSTLLLCIFHVLQAVWRYMLDSKHEVRDKDHRSSLFLMFRKILYSGNEEEFQTLYDEAMKHPLVLTYKHVLNHFSSLRGRASEWALCFRSELLTRGHNTNNYSEATIRVVKDKVVCRTKAFSLVQLFDFLTTRLNAHYERRITSVLNNRAVNYLKSRYFIRPNKLVPLKCVKLTEEGFYKVQNSEKGTEYIVNMHVEICSCPQGTGGAPCKHLCAVVQEYNLSSSQFLPFSDVSQKLILHKILTGSTNVPDGWYDSLKGGVSANSRDALSRSHPDVCETDTTVQQVSSYESNGTIFPNELEDCKQKLRTVTEDLISRLEARPDTYLAACTAFVKSYELSSTNDASLTSALHMFHKNFGPSALRVGRKIPVSTQSAQRRTTYLGGRHVQHSGRPPKSALAPEHGYSVKRSCDPSWAVPRPKTKFAAPHSLSQRVENASQKP